jgi:hypothetical protein
MTLDEFQAESGQTDIQDLVGRITSGSFMECHKKIAEERGIWIDELVPIFEKLDALLVTRPLPQKLATT